MLAIVTHYRCEAWLNRCLESLVNQTRASDRIVVIDDASENLPISIVKQFPQVTLLASSVNVGTYRLIQQVINDTNYDAYLFQDADDNSNIKYFHLPCIGAFHKTKALNIGLSLAQGEFIAPFDVDLILLNSTLVQHVKIAQLSPLLLATGYRVMPEGENIDTHAINCTSTLR